LQAVDAFLKSMGLTAAELAAQPDLVDLMTAYHFIPGEPQTLPPDNINSILLREPYLPRELLVCHVACSVV
jgi:hypothetical protein